MRYMFADMNKETMDKYINMVKKVYPDFNAETQYCLWIISDFWHNAPVYSIWGTWGSIDLLDENDSQVICSQMPDKAKQIVRTPYVNKDIKQIGIKCGRKCCFGMPLVFDSVDGLMEIKTIKCHWDVGPATFDAAYHIDFEKHADNRWFTLRYEYGFDYHSNSVYEEKFLRRNSEGMKSVNIMHDYNEERCIDMYHHEKKIKLTAGPYPDILPEPAFGFSRGLNEV